LTDNIDGDPTPMTQYSVDGPVVADPDQPIRSRMAEAVAFSEAEAKAAQNLTTFAREANAGFKDYTNVAQTSGKDYFDSDAAGQALIHNVAKGG
jgi:hypothetical protein